VSFRSLGLSPPAEGDLFYIAGDMGLLNLFKGSPVGLFIFVGDGVFFSTLSWTNPLDFKKSSSYISSEADADYSMTFLLALGSSNSDSSASGAASLIGS
jgi:hypothetical protein